MIRAWWLVAAACRSSAVEPVTVDDPRAHWPGDGFVEMVPAIRPPTSLDGRDRITTWLRVPGTIGVRRLDDGRAVLVYPPGTVADRIELDEPVTDRDDDHAWRVIDVRGTRLDGDGERFHCLRPDGAALSGFEWSRGDDDAERDAADRMFGAGEQRLHRLARCEACHDHDRAAQLARSPHRATDDAGFYSPLAVLADTAPLEDHRPRDLEADDPYVVVTHRVAHVDFARARAAGRVHEQAVCRSRRYLYDHMDAAARAAFAPAFADCAFDGP